MKRLEDLLEIHQLHRDGYSKRGIAQRLGMHRNTVTRYLEDGKETLSKDKLTRKSKLDGFKEMIRHYLDEDIYVSAVWIYDHLVPAGFTGSYEIVKEWVRGEKAELSKIAYERFETRPGQQAQVDFGEFKVEHADGRIETVYLFSMILGYSRYLYGELIHRCDLPTFLDCHIRAFAFFGGVPKEILYDRMKNVYIGRLAGRQAFNPSLLGFALHYGFTPLVAPAYAAWVKGKIERPYSFIREGFWRGYSYTDMDRGNRELSSWLEKKSHRKHGTVQEVVLLRFTREQPTLSPLPENAFDTSWRLYRTVQKDCTIRYLQNQYVVEHGLVGQKITVRVKDTVLRVFDGNRLVVTYSIPEGQGHLVQDPRFYEALRKDAEMTQRKYTQVKRWKGRAKATISPLKPLYDMDVEYRPLDQYEAACGGLS